LSILNILDRLEAEPSTNKKLEILKYHRDNPFLREAFRCAYSKDKSFYIKSLQSSESAKNESVSATLKQAFDALDRLANREVTGNAARDYIADLMSRLNEDDAIVLNRILGRDLRCGCSATTANKVWPNLINKFPCMLCESYSEKNLAKIEFPAIVQEKCDGMRANFIVKGNNVEVYSRNGKIIDIHGALDDEILTIRAAIDEKADMVFDGELLVADDGGLCDRATGNGILNRAIKNTITDDECSRIVTKLWDVIPANEFSWEKNAKGTTPLYERWVALKTAIESTKPKKISTPQTQYVATLEEAMKFYAEQLEKGREGAVLKSKNGVWENRRSKSQVKMKVEKEVELRVISKNEGTGRFVGNLGSLCCVSEDGGVEVNVSGFSDKQRDYFWNSDDIVGSIITVKANDYITNDNSDKLSLFLPVFVEERLDKDTANTTNEIRSSFDRVYGRNHV